MYNSSGNIKSAVMGRTALSSLVCAAWPHDSLSQEILDSVLFSTYNTGSSFIHYGISRRQDKIFHPCIGRGLKIHATPKRLKK